MLFTSQKQFFIRSNQLTSDDLEVVFECFLLALQVGFLLVHKFFKFIKLPFFNVGQDGRTNDLELVCNFCLTNLEVVDFLENIITVASTLINKTVTLEHPVVFMHTGINNFVECAEMIIEQSLFSWVNQKQNVVVVSDDQHNILT